MARSRERAKPQLQSGQSAAVVKQINTLIMLNNGNAVSHKCYVGCVFIWKCLSTVHLKRQHVLSLSKRFSSPDLFATSTALRCPDTKVGYISLICSFQNRQSTSSFREYRRNDRTVIIINVNKNAKRKIPPRARRHGKSFPFQFSLVVVGSLPHEGMARLSWRG